jgi:hypothetical protein
VKKKQKILSFIIIVTVVTMGTFFFIGSIIPIEATKKDGTLLEDYDDLKELVGHIKNGNFSDNHISLNDIKNSVAYQLADGNMQDCITLAAKIGHNLGDYEIVHCFENENYFKQKYSIVNNSTSNTNINSANRINNSNSADTSITGANAETSMIGSIAETNATIPVTNMTGSIAETNTTGPDTTHPETTGPDTTHPETTGPDTTHPDATGPDTTSPVTTSPVTNMTISCIDANLTCSKYQ